MPPIQTPESAVPSMLWIPLWAVGWRTLRGRRPPSFASWLTAHPASSSGHCPNFRSPRADPPAHGQVDSQVRDEVFLLVSHTLYNDSTVSPTPPPPPPGVKERQATPTPKGALPPQPINKQSQARAPSLKRKKKREKERSKRKNLLWSTAQMRTDTSPLLDWCVCNTLRLCKFPSSF